MKCLALIIVMILLVCGTSFASNGTIRPPIGEEKVDDIHRYFEFNEYVQNIICVEFDVFFPDTVLNDEKANYQYWYSCGLFGDPHFSVYLSQQHTELDRYYTEKERLLSFNQGNSSEASSNVFFLMGSFDEIRDCTDDLILDGMVYQFEIVTFDDENLQIKYYLGQVWDSGLEDEQLGRLQEFLDLE